MTKRGFLKTVIDEAAFQGFRHCGGLLIDFLEHVVTVFALIDRIGF